MLRNLLRLLRRKVTGGVWIMNFKFSFVHQSKRTTSRYWSWVWIYWSYYYKKLLYSVEYHINLDTKGMPCDRLSCSMSCYSVANDILEIFSFLYS